MSPHAKRIHHARPVNWEIIAEEAKIYGNYSTLKTYASVFANATSIAATRRLNRWKCDLKNGKVSETRKAILAYSREIDVELSDLVTIRGSAGLSIDNSILRQQLLTLLTEYNLTDLLKEDGGKHTFRDSWAHRFFARHGMVLRVCTTKMRELPADLEDKKATSIRIGRALIFTYKTPAELVIGRDETDARFVNHASRTREAKGAKRCKISGKGSDKAQITVTIFVTESGEELPYQMIFEGKTVKCHPLNQLKPADCLWTHTESHWQSVPTYIEAIEKIIVPYKNNVISSMGLPANQHTILKHDLHYTHKDARVL